MTESRKHIESFFEKLARIIYRNPIKILFAAFLFIGFLIFQIPKLTIDTSTEGMLYKDDPIITEYKAFQDQFGKDEIVFISVASPDIFSAKFLTKLKSFHEDLGKEVPYMLDISSLINARTITGKDDMLIVSELLSEWPEKDPGKEFDLTAIKKWAQNNPFIVNHLISESGKLTAVIIEIGSTSSKSYDDKDLMADLSGETDVQPVEPEGLNYLSEKEEREVVDAMNRIISRYHGPDFSIAITGHLVVIDAYNRTVKKDIILLSVLGLLVVTFFLWLLFRRISGIMLPAMVIIFSFLCSLGFMHLCDMPVTMVTPMLASLLSAVGVADAIHIMAIFYRELHEGTNKEEAIVHAISHSAFPVVLTSLTTATGLLSFTFAELLVVAQLGVYAAFGIIMALVFTVILIPAFLAIIPVKQNQTTGEQRQMLFMDRLLTAFANFSSSHPLKILAIVLGITMLAIPYIFQIRFGFNLRDFFPDSNSVKKDLAFIDKELKGSITMEVVVDTEKINGIKDPMVLNQIEALTQNIKKMENPDITIGKVLSINDIIKEVNQALHGNDPEFYRIPQDPNVISQELFLFQNSGTNELNRIVDSTFSKTRITIKTTWADALVFEKLILAVTNQCHDLFQSNTKISVTGLMALATRALNAAVQSMAKGYLYAFVAITLLMIFLVGNIKIGLISMIPNILPVLFIMGIMGFLDINFDILTMMIGCVAIGIVVDDTMHFIYNFEKYYHQSKNPHVAIQKTLTSTGRAMLFTSIILCSCFLTTALGSLTCVIIFGFLTAATVLLALLADFLVAPALMLLMKQGHKSSEKTIQPDTEHAELT